MYENILQLNQITRISSPALHSAFTDLLALDDELLICHRQATNHISGDGRIEVCRLSTSGQVLQRMYLSFPGVDLRDPKLSTGPDGRFWLIAYARFHASESGHSGTRMVSWFSTDGRSWSSPHYFGKSGWWLWRIRWFNEQAYGFAYNRAQNRLDLYAGHPGKQMYLVAPQALSKQKHALGYPNESDLYFNENGEAWALVRRDADSYTAQLGYAVAPYTCWRWQDLGTYVGGPVLHRVTQHGALVAGRAFERNKPITRLWLLDLPKAKLNLLLTLPSSADNSYPGIVVKGDAAYISYYSGHIDDQTRVYMAQVSGIKKLLQVIEQ